MQCRSERCERLKEHFMADCSSLGLREMCCFEFVEFYKVVDSAPWYSLPLNVTVISLACVAMAMTVGANKKPTKIWEANHCTNVALTDMILYNFI